MERLVVDEYNKYRLDLNSMRAKEYQMLIRYHKKEIETLKTLRLAICNKQFTSNTVAYDLDNQITEHRRRQEEIIAKYIKIYTII